MPAPNAGELLHLVGFVTGTVLYAMLLVLVLRTPAAPRGPGAADRLPLATALLGLVWNLGELLGYVLPRAGWGGPSAWAGAVSLPALGLLAAVVVHSVARQLPGGRVITMIAYACSIAAGVLHLTTQISGGPSATSAAFGLLTICFGTLIVPLAILTRRQANGRRALWILALALFAISASHLGRFHGGNDNWLVELAGHHAAIPLAFAILYQDYRFALADLFLKNALILLTLVALAFAGYSLAAALPNPGTLSVGLLLALWVATALVSPWLRRRIVRFVDTVLLARGDYARLGAELGHALQAQDTVPGVLDAACGRIARALGVGEVRWLESASAGADRAGVLRAAVHTADAPGYVLLVGDLQAGRRLLSDDVAFVEHAADLVGRRIDAIRLTDERFERRLREEEMLKLAVEAELRALRAQVNPHFLFNALTTIGYLIETAPPRALRTLMRLTALLRGVLRSQGEFTTLGREIELVAHYLDIERERFEERLIVDIDVPPALRALRVPSLIVQPLVENAVKHGIARATLGGQVVVTAALRGPDAAPRLVIVVRNTGAPLSLDDATVHEGVGLSNVERRLAGHFGDRARLSLLRASDGWTTAILELPVDAAAEPAAPAADSDRRRVL